MIAACRTLFQTHCGAVYRVLNAKFPYKTTAAKAAVHFYKWHTSEWASCCWIFPWHWMLKNLKTLKYARIGMSNSKSPKWVMIWTREVFFYVGASCCLYACLWQAILCTSKAYAEFDFSQKFEYLRSFKVGATQFPIWVIFFAKREFKVRVTLSARRRSSEYTNKHRYGKRYKYTTQETRASPNKLPLTSPFLVLGCRNTHLKSREMQTAVINYSH